MVFDVFEPFDSLIHFRLQRHVQDNRANEFGDKDQVLPVICIIDIRSDLCVIIEVLADINDPKKNQQQQHLQEEQQHNLEEVTLVPFEPKLPFHI